MKKIFIFLVYITVILSLFGCTKKQGNNFKCKDLEFEIVDKEDIPQKILEKVFQKKEKTFQFTYSNGKEMYIVIGYGAKPTGGYSIKVESVQQCIDKIIAKTELIEPSKEEVITQNITYPYIVIKIKDLGLDVDCEVN